MHEPSPETVTVPWGNGYTETSRLLQPQVPVTTSISAETGQDWAEPREDDNDERRQPATSWQREAKTIAAWSAPLIVTNLLQRSVNIASVFVVGKIGRTELAAVSLATITASLMGNSLVQGLASSLDTLAAEAYGSGHYHLVGLHMQRMMCFVLGCVVPLMALWWKADEILAHILPDHRLAELVGTYLKIMSFRMPAFVLFECGKRFVQAQGIFYATTYVLLIAAPLNAFIMWSLVWRLGWGFVGAPVAIVITENVMPVLLFLYVWLVDGSQCCTPPVHRLGRGADGSQGPMIRLALPGMMMHVAEFAVEEILTLASARFGTAQLAAQSALLTIVTISYNLSWPVSVAASTRVANWIGAQATGAARISAKVTVVFGLLVSAFLITILCSLRHQIPRIFTRDPEVIEILVGVFPIATCMQVFDGLAIISHGLMRGIGSQDIGGYVNLAVYYMIALPVSLITAFPLGWQIQGLWTGITTGLCLVSAFEFWWLQHSDWGTAVEKATRRNGGG